MQAGVPWNSEGPVARATDSDFIFGFKWSWLELLQKADIILVKEPDVVDAIADHRNAFDAKTEGPAGPHFRIVAHILKHRWMNHAAAGDLQPLLAHLAGERAGEIDLEARFGVAEVVRAEANPHVFPEHLFEDKLDRALKVADGHASIDIHAVDLLEGRVVRGVGVIPAIHPARHDNAHRRRLRFKDAHLNRSRVSAQQQGT